VSPHRPPPPSARFATRGEEAGGEEAGGEEARGEEAGGEEARGEEAAGPATRTRQAVVDLLAHLQIRVVAAQADDEQRSFGG